jgi:hypothetical protein
MRGQRTSARLLQCRFHRDSRLHGPRCERLQLLVIDTFAIACNPLLLARDAMQQ